MANIKIIEILEIENRRDKFIYKRFIEHFS